ncbi:MAG TPA: hypothetical protein VGF37_11265 [Chthoniobacterales bacterium]
MRIKLGREARLFGFRGLILVARWLTPPYKYPGAINPVAQKPETPAKHCSDAH